MKKASAAFLAVIFSAGAFAGPIIRQDFENTKFFKAQNQSAVSGNDQDANGLWTGFRPDFAIVKANSAFSSGRQAFQISRLETGHKFFAERKNMPQYSDREYTFSFDFKPGLNGSSCFGFRLINSADESEAAQFHFLKDNVLSDRYGNKTKFKVVPGKWQQITFKFIPNEKWLNVTLKTEDGEVLTSGGVKLVKFQPMDKIDFFHLPGMTEPVLIDNVNLSCENGASVHQRDNVAIGLKAQITDVNGTRNAPRLVDGILDRSSAETAGGLPSELLIDFENEYTISSVRLHTGIAQQYGYPSTCTSVTKYKVEVFSTATGHWREVAIVEDAPVAVSRDEDDAERFSQADFPAIEANKVKITILDGSDVGKRTGQTKLAVRTNTIREIEVYSHAKGDGTTGLAKVLDAEFRLPVYRDQEYAELYAVLDKSVKELPITVSFQERYTKSVPAPPVNTVLKSGENIIKIKISDWPNGQYRALIKGAGSNPRARGEFGRHLRLNRLPDAEIPVNADWTGKRLYFPDMDYFTEHSNVAVKVFKPEIQMVNKTFVSGPDHAIQLSHDVFFTPDGRLALKIAENNWGGQEQKIFYAVATPGEWNWEIVPNRPPEDKRYSKSEFIDNFQPHMSDPPADVSVFKMYDKERDGEIDLSQLRLIYAGYRPKDLGVFTAKPGTTWLVWVKSPTEYLMIKDQPIMTDRISGEEAEDPFDTIDNFSGKYLSEDGKTLYYVRGRTLKRYAPFIARYDNLWMVSRILAVFSTQDGINWKQNFFSLPDENDYPTMQHYGSRIHRAPKGNGLMLSLQSCYSALHQHYDIELVYSRDGRKWERFDGHEKWIKAGNPGDWNFGYTNIHTVAAEKDGKTYLLIGRGSPHPHFTGDVYPEAAKHQLTGEVLRKKFERRNITAWPYWKHFGSYDKLAEYLRTSGMTCGVAIFRTNGMFGVTAAESGTFTTIPLRASGRMSANFRTGKDGYIKFEVLDDNGSVIKENTLNGDCISAEVFDSLPTDSFRIRATLHKAEVFNLEFF